MNQGLGRFRDWARLGIVLSSIFFLLSGARAEILLADDFNYTDGQLVGTGTNNWTTHSGAANELLVISTRIQLKGANSEDVNAPLRGQPYASGLINHFYASFVVRFTALPGVHGAYFAHFKGNSTTAFAGRVWALTSGAAPGRFRIGISPAGGSVVSAIHPNDLDLNTDYLVVTRMVNSNSVTKLWIDPVAEIDPAVSASEPGSGFTVAAYGFRQAAGIGEMSIDNLRVGTEFTDVVANAVPYKPPRIITAPRNQSVKELNTVSFNVTAEADPPPVFRWYFNDTILPGETNASLVLTNASFAHAGFYSVTISNAIDVATSVPVALNVYSSFAPAFSLLNYNLHGNGVLNWSTNTSRIRAIGRQVQFLDPDILAFQEIPVTNNGTAQMENFVKAFRPGFHLATNSTDDLHIRSVIISRFPIVASRSWLHGLDLAEFGYSNSGFTRDLFEAEIAIPGFPQPLHVFTVHLKSGQDTDSAAKRGAEAGAVSNFFATAFLTTNSLRPYVLTGDFNEDIARPPASNPRSVQKLANAGTGLCLTTPFNLINQSELTFSIQSADGLTRRYDYILPCGLLWSNAVGSAVFRSDVLNPLPGGLFSNDTHTASDHLPVLMVFGNPYTKPFQVLIWNQDEIVNLSWQSVPGQSYRVESSSNLITWTALIENLPATNTTLFAATNASSEAQFFRIRRF
jgi:endonuclease/exonuclease/phosphatase family metal-dependent hydrolase